MKLRYLLSVATVSFLMSACSNEESFIAVYKEGVLSASVEGNHSSTRAGFDEKGKFFWSANDKLGVTTTTVPTEFSPLNLVSGSGSANGSFKGTISGDVGDYAMYPYNKSHRMNGTTLTYCFPKNYEYTKVDNDFFTEEEGEGNSFNPAMWGKITEGNVQLKHLGGVFCIKIPEMPLESGKFCFITDQKISGDFTVDLSSTGSPNITTTESSADNNTVTIAFSGATKDNPGVFYVPVPVGTYKVQVKVTDNNDNEEINIPAGTYSVDRCDLKKIEFNNASIDATPCTLTEVTENLKTSSDAVIITDVITSSSSATITIPSISGTSSLLKTTSAVIEPLKSFVVSFESIETNANITIKDENYDKEKDEANSVDNITVSIPNNEKQDFTHLSTDIKMPNSTVILDANAGSATYKDVTVEALEVEDEDDEGTIIIRSNVTIENLQVTTGSVLVETGAVLKKISVDKNSRTDDTGKIDKVKLICETGAIIPPTTDIDSECVSVAEKYNQEPDLEEMSYIFRHGGTYTMQHNLDITGRGFYIPKSRKATLDLNGYTLTAGNSESSNITVLGNFTIEDNNDKGGGKIIANYDYTENEYNAGIIDVQSGGKMTMKSGTINTVRENASNNGQFGISVSGAATVDIQGGKIEAGWYAVYGLDKYSTSDYKSQIIISGGELTSSADYVFDLPQSGSTIITGGSFKGAKGIIEKKGGNHKISIKGGSFTNFNPCNCLIGGDKYSLLPDDGCYVVTCNEAYDSEQYNEGMGEKIYEVVPISEQISTNQQDED